MNYDNLNLIVKNRPYKKKFFCKECQGINIIEKNQVPAKTISYFNKKENSELINPFFLYQKMRSGDKNLSLPNENCYSYERKDIVNFMTKLTNKFKVSQESFYLAILFLDYIIPQIPNNNSELDLLAIGSFFLAGINFTLLLIF